MYLQQFREAINRTANKNLATQHLAIETEKQFLTSEVKQKLQHFLENSGINPEILYLNTFQFVYEAKSYLEDLLQTKVYYTIGSLNICGEPCFKLTEERIDDHLKTNILEKKYSFNGHVWLTLSTMEIIDLTYPTIDLIETDNLEGYAPIIAKHSDDLQKNGIAYKPMLVGKEFMYEINEIVKFG